MTDDREPVPEVKVRSDGSVEVLGWVFDPEEEDADFAWNAMYAWALYCDYLLNKIEESK